MNVNLSHSSMEGTKIRYCQEQVMRTVYLPEIHIFCYFPQVKQLWWPELVCDGQPTGDGHSTVIGSTTGADTLGGCRDCQL